MYYVEAYHLLVVEYQVIFSITAEQIFLLFHLFYCGRKMIKYHFFCVNIFEVIFLRVTQGITASKRYFVELS